MWQCTHFCVDFKPNCTTPMTVFVDVVVVVVVVCDVVNWYHNLIKRKQIAKQFTCDTPDDRDVIHQTIVKTVDTRLVAR